MAHAELTPAERRVVNDSVGWDDRKTLSDIYQDAGGRIDSLDDATYEALLAVATYGATQAVLCSQE